MSPCASLHSSIISNNALLFKTSALSAFFAFLKFLCQRIYKLLSFSICSMTISRREVLAITVLASTVPVVDLPPLRSFVSSVLNSLEYPEIIIINGEENGLLGLYTMALGRYYIQGQSRNDTSIASEMYSSLFSQDGLEKISHRENGGRPIQPFVYNLLSDIRTAHEDLHPLTIGRPLTVNDYFDFMDHLVAQQTRTSLSAAELLAKTNIGRDDASLTRRLNEYAKSIPKYS